MVVTSGPFLGDTGGNNAESFPPDLFRKAERRVDILLAIHQPDLRLAIDLLLREEPGLNVVGVARESKTLLALLRVVRPGMLLLDWVLSGHPLTDVLAKILEWPDRPKIIVLGTIDDDREAILAAGADAFVVKGEAPQQLLTEIHQLVMFSGSSEKDKGG